MTRRIITREEWGAEYGRGHATDGAKPQLIVHHDGKMLIRPSASFADECALMRRIERYHSVDNGWNGIAYTDVLMPYSARIFQGRGFGRTGSHVPGQNSSSLGLFIPVNGDEYEPTPEVIEAFHWYRAEAIRLGHLAKKHVVRGHQDYNKPECPGDRVYRALVREVDVMSVPTFRDFARAHPTLRQGKGGKAAQRWEQDLVRLLQSRLHKLGYLEERHITGFFGPLTDGAVRRYQANRRLTVDGVVGPQTYKAMGF